MNRKVLIAGILSVIAIGALAQGIRVIYGVRPDAIISVQFQGSTEFINKNSTWQYQTVDGFQN